MAKKKSRTRGPRACKEKTGTWSYYSQIKR